MPYIRVYNLACLLHIGLVCILQASPYSTWSIESQIAHPFSLVALRHWILEVFLNPALQHYILYQDTAITWREIRKSFIFYLLSPDIYPSKVNLCSLQDGTCILPCIAVQKTNSIPVPFWPSGSPHVLHFWPKSLLYPWLISFTIGNASASSPLTSDTEAKDF